LEFSRVSSRHEKDFFKSRRQWSQLKHRILAYYLEPWATKLGSRHTAIFVVDAFAGAGSYGDPLTGNTVDGSPVIEVNRAQAYEASHPDRRMEVICVEHNSAHFASLRNRIESSPAKPTLIHGDFTAHAAAIAARIGNAPALILLDPIGIKSISADACAPLLFRSGPTDVFIIVHFAVVHRVGGMLDSSGAPKPSLPRAAALASTIDRFFRTDAWRQVAVNPNLNSADRDARYLELYFTAVLGERYRYKSGYRVRASYRGGTKYWLVHASNHRDGIELMNDAIVSVDLDLLERSSSISVDENVLPGLEAMPVKDHTDAIERRVRERLLELLEGGGPGGILFVDLKGQLFDEFFGQVKTGLYARCMKQLVRDGVVAREDRASAGPRDDERISITR
jgi:three-Cys-motif partner protein